MGAAGAHMSFMQNRRMSVVVWLAGAIALAQLVASMLRPEAQQAMLEAFAVIPARFDHRSGLGYSGLTAPLLPLFGHVFLHGGWLHLAMNLLVLLQIGGAPAQRFAFENSGHGAMRFLALFFGSAAAGALAYIWINPGSDTPAIGASGAVCGVFAANILSAGRTWQESLRERAVISAGFWFLVVNVGLAAAARVSGIIPIAWEAHLGGFIGGLLIYPFLEREPRRSEPLTSV